MVSIESAIPAASLAIVFAEAGATRKASAFADDLEVADRVVLGRGVAREGAAHRVALELVDQHRRADDPLERGGADEALRRSGVISTRTPWPACVASRASSSAL